MNAVILAAGAGKRMKSRKAKVLHSIMGKPMIDFVLETVKESGCEKSIVVTGHNANQVEEHIKNVQFAFQEKQLGTGHALMCTKELLEGENVLVLSGDTPLITSGTIKKFLAYHTENKNTATVLTADIDEPWNYGRIIRKDENSLERIVEERDATLEERKIKEINSGIYVFSIKELLSALDEIDNKNEQGEYYLTDVIEILVNKGLKTGAFKIADYTEVLGVNDRMQLAKISEIMKYRILNQHMVNGVTIINPQNTYIEKNVEIGADTVIYPGCFIQGNSKIGENCNIDYNCKIVDSVIENNVSILNSIILDSYVKENATIGPFAYIRPHCVIGNKVKVGDFVELKNSTIDSGSKIPHLSYIGDAEIGKGVNIGCGTITVNYDGYKKYKTIIKDNAFIGCNTNLVAPVVVNKDGFIAAGSTITRDVDEKELAVGRTRQINKPGWVAKYRKMKGDDR